MLNVENWHTFLLSELFDIRKGKRLTREDQIEGDTPFIGATACNNGITAYIGQKALHQGNTISLTYNGSVGEAFYQPTPFWASDDVNVLYPRGFTLTEKSALFICTVLRHEKQMWSYARKWNLDQMNTTSIKLPVNKSNQIDLLFMEEFMDRLDGDVSAIPDYFLNEGYEKASWYLDNVNQELFEEEYAGRKENAIIQLNERNWCVFKFGELVTSIQNSNAYNASDLVVAADGTDYIPYITRKDDNNGIAMYAQVMDYPGLEKANAITIGDTTATIFYQSHDFITGPHIIVIRADWLNVYTASFIITLLNQEKYRYPVFGRAFTKDLIAETRLNLPVDADGHPDYAFMEEYIKSLPFSVRI